MKILSDHKRGEFHDVEVDLGDIVLYLTLSKASKFSAKRITTTNCVLTPTRIVSKDILSTPMPPGAFDELLEKLRELQPKDEERRDEVTKAILAEDISHISNVNVDWCLAEFLALRPSKPYVVKDPSKITDAILRRFTPDCSLLFHLDRAPPFPYTLNLTNVRGTIKNAEVAEYVFENARDKRRAINLISKKLIKPEWLPYADNHNKVPKPMWTKDLLARSARWHKIKWSSIPAEMATKEVAESIAFSGALSEVPEQMLTDAVIDSYIRGVQARTRRRGAIAYDAYFQAAIPEERVRRDFESGLFRIVSRAGGSMSPESIAVILEFLPRAEIEWSALTASYISSIHELHELVPEQLRYQVKIKSAKSAR